MDFMEDFGEPMIIQEGDTDALRTKIETRGASPFESLSTEIRSWELISALGSLTKSLEN